MTEITFVVPGPLETLTGGFLYDRRIIEGLRSEGRAIDVVQLEGDFPMPDAAARDGAAVALAALPDSRVTVIDGLALGALPELAARAARRLKLIALVHHPLAEETGLSAAERTRFRALETEALASVMGIIVTSGHTAEALRDYGVAPDRVRAVCPGVDPAPIAEGSGEDGLALLTVGSLIPRKGHLDLVEALAGLTSLPWRLTCVGSTTRDAETTRQLRSRIDVLGLAERVSILGERSPSSLAAHYAASDLFVLPSYHEGYGMALSEALARGLPVVSTTAGAIPGTVPGDAGILVAPGDRSALSDALRRVMTDGALYARLASGARRARQSLSDWSAASASFGRAVHDLAMS